MLSAAFESSSDDDVLAAMASLPALADESDRSWESNDYWQTVAYPYLALTDVAAKRRLPPAVRLLLERACYGDPGESMRGLRHAFEAIFQPDWVSLADQYLALARDQRLGTRLWAIDGLMVMDDARAIPVFEASVREDPEEIRWRAEIGLDRLLRPENFATEAQRVRDEQEQERQERLKRESEKDARITDRRCPNCNRPMPSYRRTCKYCGATGVGL